MTTATPHETTHPQYAAGWIAGHDAATEGFRGERVIDERVMRPLLAQVWDEGYQAGLDDGRQAERDRTGETIADILATDAEIWAACQQIGAQTTDQRRAAFRAQLDEWGDRVNAELGRPTGYHHPGGPVDWETGRPLRALAVAA